MRVQTVNAAYPVDERRRSTSGTVTLQLTIDATGNVVEARRPVNPDPSVMLVTGNTYRVGPPLAEPFARSALSAVRQWRYAPPKQAPLTFFVRISFVPTDLSTVVWEGGRPPLLSGPNGRVTNASRGGAAGVLAGLPGVPPPPPPPAPGAPVRVGGTTQAPKKIKDARPVYPPIAQSARVQGAVILEATIGTDGRVTDVRVMKSIPLLDQAALDAVRQWEFTPTLLNGEPTAIIMTVTVSFQLTDGPEPPPAPQQ